MPERGETRQAMRSTTACPSAFLAEDAQTGIGFGYLSTCLMVGTGVPTELAWLNNLSGNFTIKNRP